MFKQLEIHVDFRRETWAGDSLKHPHADSVKAREADDITQGEYTYYEMKSWDVQAEEPENETKLREREE